jgi:hypothetical protein
MIGTEMMDRNDRQEMGEKLLVAGGGLTVATELSLILLSYVIGFSWVGFLYSCLCSGVIMYLLGRVYTGNRSAHQSAVIWSVLQIVVSVVALVLLLRQSGGLAVPAMLGLPAIWLAVLKLIIYLNFTGILVGSRSVQAYLGAKRGEEIVHEAPVVETKPSGITVTLTETENKTFAGLAAWFKGVGMALFLVGVVRFITGWHTPLGLIHVLVLVEGAVLAVVGLMMAAPASALKQFQSEGNDRTYLMVALESLDSFAMRTVLLGVVLIVVAVVGVVLRLS